MHGASDEEQERLLREWDDVYDALQRELAKIPPDELERLRQELIDEVDEAIRRMVIEGRRAAGWEEG